MARKMLKPYSFLLYFLSLLVFFFVGVSYAGWIEAGKNQGLAAGAIVLGYGFVGGLLGICASLFAAYHLQRAHIFRLNIILALSLAAFCTFYTVKYQRKKQERQSLIIPKKKPNPTLLLLFPQALQDKRQAGSRKMIRN